MDDIQNLFKETIAEFMEGSLESDQHPAGYGEQDHFHVCEGYVYLGYRGAYPGYL